jgi:glc operon protein GlcG
MLRIDRFYGSTQDETIMHMEYSLSHHDAQKIISVIQAELDKQGKGAAVAVVDAHGELLAFLRTDGCLLPSINNAINKAFTAARQREDSATIGKKSRERPYPLTNFGDLRYIGWGGGVPIIYQGQVIGAVGVSGLPEAEDIVLAQTGAAAITGA